MSWPAWLTSVACGPVLARKGYFEARFRYLFGDVPVRVPRLRACPGQGSGAPNSFAALGLGKKHQYSIFAK